MKRFIFLLSVLSLTVACTELYGPEETPLTPDSAAGVQISISDVTDNSFKVTVTPSGESSYYSYLVDNADAAEVLDAETLYKVGYKSVAQGTVKWTKDAPSYTFDVEAKPNTTYQVYAVAASPMGFAGEVAVTSVKTTDTVAPAYAAVDAQENVVLFTFSENIKRGTGDIKVAYYAPYSPEYKTAALPAGEVTVPEAGILVSANKSQITVPGLPTGCYWTISIPEGAYVDAVGQKIPAYASTFVMTEKGPQAKGFAGEVSYVETPMLGTLEAESFADWTKPFVIPVQSQYAVAGLSSKKFVTATYESNNKTIVHTLVPKETYGITAAGFVVYLPEQPDFGAKVTIDIPAGCVYDIYGNDCEAWSYSLIHSYGYTLDDVVGHYEGQAVSYWNGPLPLSFTIAESDNAEYGNVMITESFMGLPCSAGNIYADFNFDGGTLTIANGQVFFTNESAVVFFAVNGADYVTLNMPESGVLSTPDAWFGAYINGSGWYDAFTDCVVERQAAATTATTSVANFNPVGKEIR